MLFSVRERLRLKDQCHTDAYPGPCQRYEVEPFAKIVNS